MSKDKKREMLITLGDTPFDKILAHHKHPEEFPLTDKEADQLARWSEIFTLLLNHFSKAEIVLRWQKEKGLSASQAYADIRNSESLFGNVLKADKEGARALWIAWTQDFLKRCKQKGDRNNEAKALLLMAKYSGFDNDEDPKFNPAKLENVPLGFELAAPFIKILENMADQGVHDFNKLDISTVEFEVVKDDTTEETN